MRLSLQPEEEAQEALEEPAAEPLLEPEGENYEEAPQVRQMILDITGNRRILRYTYRSIKNTAYLIC